MLSLPIDLAIKLQERNPVTTIEADEWADNYDFGCSGTHTLPVDVLISWNDITMANETSLNGI